MKGQNVSVFCFNANQSLTITYSLFRNKTYLGTQDGKGEPTVFNQSILGIKDLGPYKCKAQVLNCSKYSQEFNFTFVETLPGGDSCPFCLPLLLPGLLLVLMVIILILAFWILRKYKARGATGDSVPKDDGETTKEVGIYVNIHTGQPGTEPSQEIHYATPTFQKVAPAQQGGPQLGLHTQGFRSPRMGWTGAPSTPRTPQPLTDPVGVEGWEEGWMCRGMAHSNSRARDTALLRSFWNKLLEMVQ
ncbi:Allergin-1 [Tupaia chinensis]|uniref:Allergin-1 n=2 Tax=Tupaia chinensis TaxID=246437 RepID=L9KX55_TUPCH|nr:Allergin-1 [Tupaia chinensis]